MNWIKCSNRLPEDKQEVLINTNGGHDACYDIAQFNKERKRFESQTTDGCCRLAEIEIVDVLFWMPLPSLPGKEHHCQSKCKLCDAREEWNKSI